MKNDFYFRPAKVRTLSYLTALFLILENFVLLAQTNCASPPSGLAAWWQAEGNANDIIGGFNGALVNGTSFTIGYVGQSFSFDGINQCITNSTPGLTNIQNSYTMEFWARPTQSRATTPESVDSIDGTSNQRYAIYPNNGRFGSVGAGVSVGTNGVSVFESGSAYLPALLVYDTPITNWTHVAVVYSNKQPSLYLNGALARVGLTSTRSSYPSTCLGEAGFGYGYYAGLLDEISIYNRALSAAEIISIYNAGTAGKCPPPSPPYITVQPTNEMVTVGSTAIFTITAGGTQPLSYQWSFNGSIIPNATSSALILPNVQFSNAGLYSVLITNSLGSTNSIQAQLTVLSETPQCAPLPADIVAWWRAEGNANDSVGTNNGTTLYGMDYVPGKIGQAFHFDGNSRKVSVPDSDSFKFTNGMTIEGWVNIAGDGGVLLYRGDNRSGLDPYGLTMGASGFVSFFVEDGNNNMSIVTAPVAYNQWKHIAATWDRGDAVLKLYVDGVLAGQTNTTIIPLRDLDPSSDPTLGIGNHGGTFWNFPFNGLIDELALFSRALSQTEIQAIYNYGVTGKCVSATGPYIYVQPTNQTVYVGQTARFVVAAGGTPFLGYQWSFNGAPIANATNPVLILSNVQFSNAGIYSVLITNSFGSVTSTNAILTVDPPPPCLSVPAGLVSWWPGEGNANDVAGTNNGVELGGVIYTNGMVGQGFYFNGAGSYVRIPSSPTLGPSNEFTLEFWYKPERTSVIEGLIARRNNESGPINYGFSINSGSYIGVYYNDPNVSGDSDWPGDFELSLYNSAPASGFHHIAAAYRQADPNTVEIKTYLDGQLVRTRTFGGVLNRAINDAPVTLGCSVEYPTHEYFQGVIDEVSLYNRALSDSEIQAIYSSGTIGKCFSATGPTIYLQPTNQTAFTGHSARMVVGASGSPLLGYQWFFNSTNAIAGATNATLTLNNLQLANGGSYSVRVTNPYGSVLSTNAVLTVLVPPPCTSAPSNILGWWRGEGNTSDEAGINPGTISGNVLYANAQVGQGFMLDGSGDAVQVGNATNLRLQDFTIEAWIRRSNASVASLSSGGGEIFGFGSGGYAFGISDTGNLYLTKVDVDNVTSSGAITDTSFHHVVVAKSGTTAIFYIDGVGYLAPSYSTTFTFSTPAAIGARGDNQANSFYGTIDEVSVYGRALSASEVQSIYNANVSGKCPTNFPPSIVTQPASQTGTVGANLSISVTAGGSTPLSYQWRFNGNNIAGATANPLVLNNVQMSQAGNYSVVVTNVAGSIISSNALLTLNFPPATIRVVSTNAVGASFVSIPIMLVANGNENAMAFSLNYDPSRLFYSSTTPGSGAPGADLMLNTTMTNGIQAGRIGAEIIMPPGITFTPGTQIVASVKFFLTNVPSPGSISITFGDQPTLRQLLDNQLNTLNATYANGAITYTVAPALEGDVFPHTNGDRTISLADWLQIGRYVARLDSPTNASEFQRADSAPRMTLGDGSIRATDWIQAGRYNAGLDLLTASGGPTNEVAPPPLAPSTNRLLSIGSASLTPGTPTTIPIMLAAQGDESALSFSVLFDPSRVAFVGASPGAGATGATMFINTNSYSSGLIGFAVALGAGNTFPAGNRELARLTFQALPTASGSFTPIFTDQPVWRDISDVTALSLPIGYSSGIISINASLNLRIAQAGTNVLLAWPLWASNFTLQEATNTVSGNSWTNLPVTPSVSNNENVVLLPIGGSLKLYRLYHP